MPGQELRRGCLQLIVRGDQQPGTVVFVVVFAVAVVFAQAVADFQDEVFGNGQVTVIKKGMEIGTQQNAVGDVVGAIHGVGLDMCGLEDGQRLFPADSATIAICFRNQDAESSLSKAVLCYTFSIPYSIRFRNCRLTAQPVHHLLIDAFAFAEGGVVLLAGHGHGRPVAGRGDPLGFRKKEGLGEDDAADMGECGVDPVLLPVGGDSIAEFLIVFCAVLFAEGLPSQVNGNRGIADEEAPAYNGIIGLFKLEQEQVIGLESMKGCAARSPEVDLVDALATKDAVPVVISQANEDVHIHIP